MYLAIAVGLAATLVFQTARASSRRHLSVVMCSRPSFRYRPGPGGVLLVDAGVSPIPGFFYFFPGFTPGNVCPHGLC
ncbi:hypothetical protein C8Q70DRAFT_342120 [Cubamyces menziesii]|nr:hypothetical protein C8Q70DRAFT_342120 [Cubamyces menziesii]